MISIDYTAVGFTPSWGKRLTGKDQLSVLLIDVVAAAVTVGRRGWADVLQYGLYSRAEILYRAFQVLANLTPVGGRLVRSAAYDGLDSSEKSAISYFVGLAVAKLVMDDLFSVPVLLHVGSYPELEVEFAPGGSRPDLVGLDSRKRWYVVEAKGRSNKAEPGLLAKAKKQTRRVRRVAKDFPSLRVAVLTEFPSGMLEVQLADPEDYDDDAVDWHISAEETLRLYYAPWLGLVRTPSHTVVTVGDRQYVTVALPELDMVAGLDMECLRDLGSLALGAPALGAAPIPDFLGRLPRDVTRPERLELPQFDPSAVRIGRDGVLLALGRSWRNDQPVG